MTNPMLTDDGLPPKKTDYPKGESPGLARGKLPVVEEKSLSAKLKRGRGFHFTERDNQLLKKGCLGALIGVVLLVGVGLFGVKGMGGKDND